MKTIDEQIAEEESEFREIAKQHRMYIRELKKQKGCEHNWTYTPMEEGDSFCFQREVGETIRCTKCDTSIERDRLPQYRNLTAEQEALFQKVKAELQ